MQLGGLVLVLFALGSSAFALFQEDGGGEFVGA